MSDVHDNRAASRFELEQDGLLAIAAYRRDGDVVTFTHTEVPVELEGHGVGSRLVAGALDQVRADGGRIVPACSFVRDYVDRHPQARDLLA